MRIQKNYIMKFWLRQRCLIDTIYKGVNFKKIKNKTMSEVDDNFFQRADDHINLSNDQLSDSSIGKVSASMMYSVARFNAWFSACEFNNADEMKKGKDETIKYFVAEYEKMLKENLNNYIENFDSFMQPKEN